MTNGKKKIQVTAFPASLNSEKSDSVTPQEEPEQVSGWRTQPFSDSVSLVPSDARSPGPFASDTLKFLGWPAPTGFGEA